MALRSPSTSHGIVRSHPSVAIRRGDIKISDPIPIPREGPDGFGPQSLKRPSVSNLRQIRQSQSSATSNSRRQIQGPTMSYHNQQDSISSSISRESNLQRRRGSALKTVMRKIFGKKRGSDANGFDTHFTELHIGRNGSVSPDHGPEGATFVTVPESFRADRSASLIAGAGHFPHGIESSDGTLTENTGRIDKQPRPRRRATLPSLILSDEDAREVVSTFTRSDGAAGGTEQPSEARRILDDLRRKQKLEDKRRSRSATALREMAKAHEMSPVQWIQGNDERKSWRTSFLGADVPQVITSRPQTGASAVVEEREIAPSEADETEPDTEAESAHYNFENLIGSMPNDDSITLEQRVITLEVKLLDLELAIAKLQGKDNRRKNSKPDRKGSYPAGQLSMSYQSGGSDGSGRSSTCGVGEGRPASTNTLRPNVQARSPMWHAPSTTSLADMNGITVEQYSALITLIRREQTARRTLETQVSQLQDDIRHLQRVAVGSLTSGTAYPIPSPDAQEVLRFRRAMGPSRSTTPAEERSPDRYDSDSENSDPYAGSDPHMKSNLDIEQRQPAADMI
ncbi:hypothetical protein DTO166G4_955 [Paecilomyces variotii]|nr:hypothetical protein DTO032I3_1382 [Paecilomyces variotii]KAJ9217324.1 hypothetical protein DTO166G4_955 [Paecilomyces variotii]KAJ9231755.1 hypothetical protein DTO166G5_6636 [Paecilomyces variotii]KAJ9244991.1 hypothetical protein DTO169E5_1372 [Paecilomyces variotii]KAJ9249558.1 hypothetical protein DTO195F2_8452 [Paecilomyces variotii]